MYHYEVEKRYVFTDEGQRKFLKVRDWANKMLDEAGAFTAGHAMAQAGGGDSWSLMALVDRLLEIGEVRLIGSSDVAWQSRVFTR